MQQLGRGLRLAENKDCLTVLDFIGQANKRYNFEEKFKSLLSISTRTIKSEIESGFINAPNYYLFVNSKKMSSEQHHLHF